MTPAAIVNEFATNAALDIVLVITILTLAYAILVARRITKLTDGAQGANLEEVIRNTHARTELLGNHAAQTDATLQAHDARIGRAIRSVAIRRFDPFQNAGGQQSFACALLNEAGDGIVLSGIHARDGVRVYAKEILSFVSERELSEDELAAIADAQSRLQ